MNKQDEMENLERLSEKLRQKTDSEENLNLGLMYGLIFALVGNLWIILLDKLLINNLSETMRVILIILVSFILSAFLLIGIFEMKRIKDNKILSENTDKFIENYKAKSKNNSD